MLSDPLNGLYPPSILTSVLRTKTPRTIVQECSLSACSGHFHEAKSVPSWAPAGPRIHVLQIMAQSWLVTNVQGLESSLQARMGAPVLCTPRLSPLDVRAPSYPWWEQLGQLFLQEGPSPAKSVLASWDLQAQIWNNFLQTQWKWIRLEWFMRLFELTFLCFAACCGQEFSDGLWWTEFILEAAVYFLRHEVVISLRAFIRSW